MEDQSKQPDRRQELMVVRAQLRDAEAKLIEFNEQLDSIKDLENRVEFLNNETTRLEAEADANQAEMQNYKDEISKLREGATQANLLSAELERQQRGRARDPRGPGGLRDLTGRLRALSDDRPLPRGSRLGRGGAPCAPGRPAPRGGGGGGGGGGGVLPPPRA